jgi:GntR family transcriptional regulator
MDFVLSRKGPATVHAQLLAQIEMKILAGEFAAARRLPSVRALARQLSIHPNTVSAVYNTLGRNGWVERERGSGLYVRRGARSEETSRPQLEELLRAALQSALLLGFSPAVIRTGVERWLATPPPCRVVVVETNEETADLLAEEVGRCVDVPVSTCLLEVALRKGVPADALAITWPIHLETLRPVVAGALVPFKLGIPAEGLRIVKDLPKGALVLVISRSMRVLPYTRWVIQSTRGDELVVNGQLLADAAAWTAVAAAADVVFADALSVRALRRVAGKRVREYLLLSDETCTTIRQHLAFAVPTLPGVRSP